MKNKTYPFNPRYPIKNIYWIIALILSCLSCTKESGIENYNYRLVVEGWIEEGGVAHVILTQNKPLFSIVDSTSMEEMVIRWAKVSVSDGEETEVLRGGIDKNYFPPFIYKGALLSGQAGKTYTLKVEYSGKVWTAETHIPQSVPLTGITSRAVPGNDTLFSVEANFDDPGTEKNYYKFFTRILHKNNRYIPSLMGNFDDNLFNGKRRSVTVNQGIEMKQIKKFEANFNIKDTVFVKFCTMPEFGFDFWTAYENELINSQNPLFPANQNLKSNIPGGRGIWCGYGRQLNVIWYDAKNEGI